MGQMQQQIQAIPEQIKLAGDGAAAGISFAAVLGWLPHIAAAGSIIWVIFRIYNEYLQMKINKQILKDK